MDRETTRKRLRLYLDERRCPKCGNTQFTPGDQPETEFELGSGYSVSFHPALTIDESSRELSENLQSVAENVYDDFMSGNLNENQLAEISYKGYRIPIEILARCNACGTDLLLESWTSVSYELRSLFWNRLRSEIDRILHDAFGIDLAALKQLISISEPEHLFVEKLFALNSEGFRELKRLKDGAIALPADKGGGGFQDFLNTLLLSILSTAAIESLRTTGNLAYYQIRSMLTRRKMTQYVKKAIAEGDFESAISNMDDSQIEKLLHGRITRTLTESQREALVSRAIEDHAEKFRKELLEIIRRNLTK